jgi:hypothetical protein
MLIDFFCVHYFAYLVLVCDCAYVSCVCILPGIRRCRRGQAVVWIHLLLVHAGLLVIVHFFSFYRRGKLRKLPVLSVCKRCYVLLSHHERRFLLWRESTLFAVKCLRFCSAKYLRRYLCILKSKGADKLTRQTDSNRTASHRKLYYSRGCDDKKKIHDQTKNST